MFMNQYAVRASPRHTLSPNQPPLGPRLAPRWSVTLLSPLPSSLQGMLLWRTRQYLSGRAVVAYADMGKELYGEQSETAIMALMWMNWMLGLGDYMLVLQSTLQAVLYDYNLCQPVWGLVVVGLLLPLTQARSLHRIRSLGAIHIGCLAMVMLLVLVRTRGGTEGQRPQKRGRRRHARRPRDPCSRCVSAFAPPARGRLVGRDRRGGTHEPHRRRTKLPSCDPAPPPPSLQVSMLREQYHRDRREHIPVTSTPPTRMWPYPGFGVRERSSRDFLPPCCPHLASRGPWCRDVLRGLRGGWVQASRLEASACHPVQTNTAQMLTAPAPSLLPPHRALCAPSAPSADLFSRWARNQCISRREKGLFLIHTPCLARLPSILHSSLLTPLPRWSETSTHC